MLARTTDPEGKDDTALLPEHDPSGHVAMEPARVEAFGNAQRHSRRVRVLKLALPILAGIIAVAFPVYSYLVKPAQPPVKADGSAFSNGKLVMANPKLDGFTKENLPYSMTALRAIQDVAKESIIGLEGIDAKLPLDASTSAVVGAAKGVYNRDANTLQLEKDITVTTTSGMVVKLKSAFLDMAKGNMKTNDPVDIVTRGSHIMSDTMSVESGGKVLVFEKRVRVNLEPGVLKTTSDKSGEPNAAQ
ncbi:MULTISPECIES: LPS export ABC transporter periplasmic protein LptC [Phyllobacteriaceae]|jgi:lipopolysaccharide export system protein LptC|uniref:LPS export ABC transporter periplasmic protein LptC n=2 Tax=Mesorhizobium TaxID=68287 RepID=A0A1C2E534_9HYPH|nr:LPS export ABC transporter periplasmic protein LptC [Mesorhizobium sp.]MDQ0329654.1 lipopolysaccharide export system protein LptC [Mesorhizobium sp. YL-MeA3-2017]OCX22111.1 LPS export ABC transporter periplasmic protein LptC [Mesorhizobium hungaricum]